MIEKEATVIYEALTQKIDNNRVLQNVPLKEHISFRVGGPCRVMVFPENEEEIQYAIECSKRENIKYFILGKGTNLIAPDDGYDGVVIKLGAEFNRIDVTDAATCTADDLSACRAAVGTIYAQAGALLSAISKKALEHGLAGFEFASGIPGSLGGAVLMNAGAYDGEIGTFVKRVRFLTAEGEIQEWTREQCDFSYRHSAFQNGQYTILGAALQFEKGEPAKIRALIEEYTRRRNEKQPLTYPSAGSTFKRPKGHFAGKLIQDAGLMGLSVGGAMVSRLHAGFVINTGNATAEDILSLIRLIQNTVFDKFGVMLEPEVRVLK